MKDQKSDIYRDQGALVLEGGGMRGVFTAGVLDLFMDCGIEFPYTIGVSAGITNGISYISRQRGRSLYADTTLLKEHPYMGYKTLLKKGVFIDTKFLYEDFAYSIYPFDWETFNANRCEIEMVATNIHTGEPCYFKKPYSMEKTLMAVKATSALPFISKVVMIDGLPLLDGGLSDSIPISRAQELGYRDIVVVLTQLKGYRKKPYKFKIPRWVYPKYPMVIDLLNSRAERYNRQIELIEQLESRGEIDVIRPTKPIKVGRLSTNIEYISDLHSQGYQAAQTWWDKIAKR